MTEHQSQHQSHTAHADAPAKSEPHMARGDFMQTLHRLSDAYAAHWDEPRVDPGTSPPPEPTTEHAWIADFTKWLGRHSPADQP